MHNLPVETDTLSRTLYQPIHHTSFVYVGARPPQFGEHSGDRGSNVVPRKTRTIEQNLPVDSEKLSLSSFYELDALRTFELVDPTPTTLPIGGRGGARSDKMVAFESVLFGFSQ